MDNATKLFKDSEFVKFTDIVPSKPLNPIVKSELMLVLKRDDIQITADYYADGATWTISSPQYKDLVLCEPDAWTTAPRTVTFWEDTSLHFLRGWCRLTVGEYAVLIVPCDGNVADLPKEYRTAAWAIFDREPPRGVEKLALAQAVLCCPEEHLPQVTRDMMWGVYPIDIAANEAVTMKLR